MTSEEEQIKIPTVHTLLFLARKNQWNCVSNTLSILDFYIQTQSSKIFDDKSKQSVLQNEVHQIVKALSTERTLRSGNTMGHLAARANRVDVLEKLLKLGVDLRRSNFSNKSPMQEARANEKSEALKFLLENVYTPVEQLFYGNDNYEKMVEVFTNHAEAINVPLRCYNNMPWIGLCVEGAKLREIRWLVDHGANLKATDAEGNTLLHMIFLPLPEWVDDGLSSESFSDTETRMSSKDSQNGSDEDSELNSKQASNLSRERYSGISVGTLFTEKLPVSAGRKDSSQIEIGASPMCAKSVDSQRSTTQKLIEKPPLRDTPFYSEFEDDLLTDVLGPLPDISYKELSKLRVLVFLLSLKEIDVNQANAAGSTPAHVAAEKRSTNPTATWLALKLLKHYGADLNIKDRDGSTVAMVFAGYCGDGPWLTWCLTDSEFGGGGCNLNITDIRGRRVEDYIVAANLEAFDAELDINDVQDVSA